MKDATAVPALTIRRMRRRLATAVACGATTAGLSGSMTAGTATADSSSRMSRIAKKTISPTTMLITAAAISVPGRPEILMR
jgi:hypothetical protein